MRWPGTQARLIVAVAAATNAREALVKPTVWPPPETPESVWPPPEADPFAEPQPAPRPPKSERLSWITDLLQRWIDGIEDDAYILWLRRERGVTMMSKRWSGKEPE